MYFYINKEKVKIPNSILFNKIGSGRETRVYKYNDKVIKIYKKTSINNDINLEKNHIQLTKIKTKQIVLPEKMYYNKNGKYVANESKYIRKDKNSILEYELEEVIYNVENLEKDTDNLSNNYINIRDLSSSNCILSDYIYIIDFGFFKLDNDDILKIKKINDYTLKLFLIKMIMQSLKNKKEIDINSIYKYYLNCLKKDITFSEILKKCDNSKKIFVNKKYSRGV